MSERITLSGQVDGAVAVPTPAASEKTTRSSVANALGTFMKGLAKKTRQVSGPNEEQDWSDFITEQDLFDNSGLAQESTPKAAGEEKKVNFQLMIEEFDKEKKEPQACDITKADELMDFYEAGSLHWVVIVVALLYVIVVFFHGRAILMYRRHRAIQARSLMFTLLSGAAGCICVFLIALPHALQHHMDKMNFLKFARYADMALHLFGLPLLIIPTVLRTTRVIGLHTHENAKRNFAGKLPLGLLGIPTMDFRELEYQLLARKNTFFSKGPLYWSLAIVGLLGVYTSLWMGLIMCKLSVKVEQIAITSHTLAVFLLQVVACFVLRNKEEAFSVKYEAAMAMALSFFQYVVQLLFFFMLSNGGSHSFSFTWSGIYHAAILGIVVLGTTVTVSWPLIACRAPDRQKMLRDPGQFKTILQHPTCRIYFTEYLASTFTSEYYLFWRDVEEFKLLKPDSNLMAEAANLIYSVYVREGSAMDLHLNYVEQLNIRNQLNSIITAQIFDTSQAAILQRMGSLFPRFLDSSYARACNYDLVGRHLDKKASLSASV